MYRITRSAAVSALVLAAGQALAQDAARSQAGQLDAKTSGANVRASQLIGAPVWNAEGKRIGLVNDPVVNTVTGRVRYAAVSYGGFLGLGEKLFAVPWLAFAFQSVQKGQEAHLVLDVSEKTIKSAPGFDPDHWPDFGDRQFTRGLEKHYGVRHRGGVSVKVGPGGVDVDVDPGRRRNR